MLRFNMFERITPNANSQFAFRVCKQYQLRSAPANKIFCVLHAQPLNATTTTRAGFVVWLRVDATQSIRIYFNHLTLGPAGPK